MSKNKKRKDGFLGTRKQHIEATKLEQEIQIEVIEFILQGYSLSEVTDYLQLNYNFEIENARKQYRKAHLQIMDLGIIDIEDTIIQHVYYYEEAIRWFNDIKDYASKATAMVAKEKLLKLFEEEENEVEINNTVNINIEQLNYDIGKLSEFDKNRFGELFKKVEIIK